MRREERRQRREMNRSPILLLFLITGLAAILFGIGDNTPVSNQMYIYTMMFLTAFSAFLWYFYFFHRRIFLIISIILALATVIIFVPEAWNTTRQAFASNEIRLSAPLIISGLILAAFVLFSFEFILRNHTFIFTVTFLLIVTGPAIGLKFGYMTVILTLFFDMAFIIVNMTDGKGSKKFFRMNDRSGISVSSTLIASAVLIVALVPAFPVEQIAEKDLFTSTGTATKMLSDAAVALKESITSNLAPEGITAEGKIHRSTIAYTGNTLMTVTVNKVPETTVYMHGFQGGSYENGAWKSAFIESFAEDVNKNQTAYQEPFMMDVIQSIHGDYSTIMRNTSDPISDIYYNYSMKNNPDKEIFTADMTEMNETYSTVCTPYFSQFSEGRIRMNHRIGENGYSNSFTSAELVNMKNYWKYDRAVEMLVDAYMERIQKEYTVVPEDSNSALKEVCDSNPLNDLGEITAFILCTLQNKAELSVQTGTVPFDRDVIDYFLFDSGKADSVYFASAATLMYRMYGIPARYVAGFIARPTDFNKSAGGYVANITDRHAYSWTEIFLKDFGWVPVDVTPDMQGKLYTAYPGFDSNTLKTVMAEHNWHFRDRAAEREEQQQRLAAYNPTPVIITVIGIILLAVAGFIAFLLLKRKRITVKPDKNNCLIIFDKMIRAIHFSKLLLEFNGSESDFYIRLAETVPVITQENAEKMFHILCKDSFAPDGDSENPDDTAFISDIYHKTSSYLYEHLKPFQRIIFKYVKNFI